MKDEELEERVETRDILKYPGNRGKILFMRDNGVRLFACLRYLASDGLSLGEARHLVDDSGAYAEQSRASDQITGRFADELGDDEVHR